MNAPMNRLYKAGLLFGIVAALFVTLFNVSRFAWAFSNSDIVIQDIDSSAYPPVQRDVYPAPFPNTSWSCLGDEPRTFTNVRNDSVEMCGIYRQPTPPNFLSTLNFCCAIRPTTLCRWPV